MVNKLKEARKLLKKNDLKWSNEVKEKFHGKCAFCPKIKYIQAHHIIPRQVKEFRHYILNGIALCPCHHKFGIESAHANPLWFMLKMGEKYKFEFEFLIMQYKKYLKNEKN